MQWRFLSCLLAATPQRTEDGKTIYAASVESVIEAVYEDHAEERRDNAIGMHKKRISNTLSNLDCSATLEVSEGFFRLEVRPGE